jgi:anti-sigma regulatory factor (Ser/Thr protein kinase)
VSGSGTAHTTFAAHGPGQSVASVSVPPLPLSETSMPGRWPLQDYLEPGALPGAVPCARLHARQLLGEWGLSDLSDDVELLVSELVTNATQASRLIEKTIAVRMWLLADEAQVLILVWDASTHTPVRASVGEDDESGRGLLLVEAISDSWGYFPHETGGKVVWALTRMP